MIITADHGETLGELGIYCDHQTADHHVARVPMIIRWPGLAPGVDDSLHYQVDVAATLLELSGGCCAEQMGRALVPVFTPFGRVLGTGKLGSHARRVDCPAGRALRRLDLHPDVPRQLPRVPRHHVVRPRDGSARARRPLRSPTRSRVRRHDPPRGVEAVGRRSLPFGCATRSTPCSRRAIRWHARWRPAEYDEWLAQTGRANWVSPCDLRMRGAGPTGSG